MVIVGRSVLAMGGDIEEVASLDEAQIPNLERDLERAGGSRRFELFDVGVRPVDGGPVGGEDADAKDEVLNRCLGLPRHLDTKRVARERRRARPARRHLSDGHR